jgi:hypothetical protein
MVLDVVQYTKRDWRNRNKIKTQTGTEWLSIPVKVSDRFLQRIQDTEIEDPDWAEKHFNRIKQCYKNAAAWSEVGPLLESWYNGCTSNLLSDINRFLLAAVCNYLGIATPITTAVDYPPDDDKNLRLVRLCQARQANVYYTGPAARAYLDENAFRENGIEVRYLDHTGYPEYPQLYGAFEHGVSIIDLLLNTGPAATTFMKHFA